MSLTQTKGHLTGDDFTGLLVIHGVIISMDGKGWYLDNTFIERLWRTVKYEEDLKAYIGGREAKAGLDSYFRFYNTERPHQALGYRTPAQVFNEESAPSEDQSINRNRSSNRSVVTLGNPAGLSLNFLPNLSH